ncbi:hypothetical protein FB567DRAFT_129080 [Paraphoma chrysanthemicola]|uniref:Uncharacterized protein n=1 Tax=Paraphoma chrysanthemicola TaxID=798071 RepID=A0A8K0R1T7_9PLEO|nr:hypothetical protein FB567DRAFT_129080 [Paraphoma chrysanthemicola]
MAQQPKPCYYLAPTRTNPPEGVIRLGSIVTSPSLVDEPISTGSPAIPDPASITTHVERNWSKSITAAKGGSIGIWASFLQFIVGVGGDVGISASDETTQKYGAKVMKWSEFRPSVDYVRAAVRDKSVHEYIRGNKFRENVYMVTGVMLASGATGVIEKMAERGLYAHVGIDATLLSGGMAPIAVGPEIESTQVMASKEQFGDADEFVIAFRLRQIKVKKTGEVSQKAKVDGALFGIDDVAGELRKRKEEEDRIGIWMEGLEEEDASVEQFRLDELLVRDALGSDGQECLCVEIVE